MSDQRDERPDDELAHRPRVPVDQDHEPAGTDEEISEQLSVDPDRDGEKG
ncbi:hypothetical protein [Nakamurella leprariae]|uniref:Uncharacterized protein n=1 Tax=Nakamurella leprariae TaxID=2803911 RepID=A0A938YEW1_9ACTN|nr:hypothetical protein [Nakamurella leprariae]MBM9469427.1 hypothetical protein [Nakamurella leprariae]